MSGVRGPDLNPRKLRPAPVRDGLVPSRTRDRKEQGREYRARLKANGLCVSCYREREGGTKTMCRPCADKHAIRCRTNSPIDQKV